MAAVPTKGVTTLYSRIGDSFAYLCLAGLAALAAWAFLHRPISGTGHAPTPQPVLLT